MFCNCGEMHWSYVHLLCTCLLVFLHLFFLGGAMTRVVATTYCPNVCVPAIRSSILATTTCRLFYTYQRFFVGLVVFYRKLLGRAWWCCSMEPEIKMHIHVIHPSFRLGSARFQLSFCAVPVSSAFTWTAFVSCTSELPDTLHFAVRSDTKIETRV